MLTVLGVQSKHALVCNAMKGFHVFGKDDIGTAITVTFLVRPKVGIFVQ